MDTLAQRIHRFGPPEVIERESIALSQTAAGEALVRIRAAGVGPWDAWIRAGRSALPQPLPLTLGSDFAGIIVENGPGAAPFAPGDDVFGITSARFTGAYAEYAIVDVAGIAKKPASLDFIAAAAVPVVSVTAWQMLFERGRLTARQRVLVHGAAGSVGAFAVQLAVDCGAEVVALGRDSDVTFLRTCGATSAYSYDAAPFEQTVGPVDLVLDTIGGDIQTRSFGLLRRGGSLISIVSEPDQQLAARHGIRASFFVVRVTTADLDQLAERFDAGAGRLTAHVGLTLPFSEARQAHELLENRASGKRGKIVLSL
jgi:NADPH:quinone reductase-like Zn-dependent oxidoreductase